MAFASTLVKTDIQGTTKVQYWTFDAAAVTTGVISTGLAGIYHASVNNQGANAAGATAIADGGDLTLAGLTANDDGTVKVEGF